MNQGQQRIPCPRCRSNNFPGHTNCWQCGATLPPPESAFPISVRSARPNVEFPIPNALPMPPPVAPGSRAMVSLPSAAPRPGFNWFYLRLGILAVTLLGMLAGATYYANLGRTATQIDSGTQQAIEQIDQMGRSMEQMINQSQQPISSPAAMDPNSVEAQAKRELERLQRQHGVTPPPVSPDGTVRLQSGGTLNPEEYERARRALRNP